MKAIKIEAKKKPIIIEMDNELHALQEAVDGTIEVIYPFADPVAIVCNEEGKLRQLPLNRALYTEDGNLYDIVAGTFLIVGLSEDNFNSIPDELVQKYMKQYFVPETFIQVNGEVVVLPLVEMLSPSDLLYSECFESIVRTSGIRAAYKE